MKHFAGRLAVCLAALDSSALLFPSSRRQRRGCTTLKPKEQMLLSMGECVSPAGEYVGGRVTAETTYAFSTASRSSNIYGSPQPADSLFAMFQTHRLIYLTAHPAHICRGGRKMGSTRTRNFTRRLITEDHKISSGTKIDVVKAAPEHGRRKLRWKRSAQLATSWAANGTAS